MYIETKQQTETRIKIIETIENVIGVPRELWEIKRTKSTTEVMLRDIYIYFLYNSRLFTLETIARIVGLKNHCTVLQSIDRTNRWSESQDYSTECKLLKEVKKSYEQRNS
jgi:chromosomal replication initiation ATPase DnaA